MNKTIQVDIGHLLSDRDSSDFISFPEFDSFAAKHGKSFEEFRSLLREKKSPLNLSFDEESSIPYIKTLTKDLKEKYENVLVLGIGGSALGARAVLQFLKGPFYNLEKHDHPRLFILDNIDPLLVEKLEKLIDLKKTAVIYTSKSGSTPETAALFIHFYKKYREAGGNEKDIVIVCDPGDNGINRIAKSLCCHLLHIPPGLPGRYSVLSSVGFLPAELAGIDSKELLAGAAAVYRAVIDSPLEENALFALGNCLYELALKGKSIHVLFNYSSFLFEFGLWYVQLWAESLGKSLCVTGDQADVNSTPLTCLGATDQHSILQLFKECSRDKVFGFVNIDSFPVDITLTNEFPAEKEYAYFAGHTVGEQLHIEQLSTEMSLVKERKPCYRITLKDMSAATLGALFYFYETLVVYIAKLWMINPYNQPGVEEGKNITYSLMGRADYSDRLRQYEQEVEKYNRERRILKI